MTRDDDSPPLSVVVVTHDEEARIEACLESVFEACRNVGRFEVVLVDSNSTDRTVELARRYPITILRIPDDDLTTPGAGRYVGSEYADGESILFVDGDMVLADGWLPEAIDQLRSDGVAAVDGHLDDAPADASIREVDSVRGVALYDADALAAVGGFDPFLQALEDVHLGYELTARGYRLVRLPQVSASHPDVEMFSETLRRWRRGYTRGNGQAIRKSLGSPRLLAKHVYKVRHRLVVGGWLAVGAMSLATGVGLLAWLALSVVGFGVVTRARGGVHEALGYGVYKVSLLVGLVVGLLEEPKPRDQFPLARVETVREGPIHGGSSQVPES